MVFNEENYPNMVRLFEELGVGAEKTVMSFRCSGVLDLRAFMTRKNECTCVIPAKLFTH